MKIIFMRIFDELEIIKVLEILCFTISVSISVMIIFGFRG